MDSQANSLINPDARTGLATPAPGAAAAAALHLWNDVADRAGAARGG